MANKCPRTTDPNWEYAVTNLTNGLDEVLVLFYKLGDRVPSHKEVDAYNGGHALTAINNQRSWDVENAKIGVVLRADNTWTTLDDNSRQKHYKRHTQLTVDNVIKNLNKEHEGKDFTFFKVPVKYIQNGKALNRWEVHVKDNRFRDAGKDKIFTNTSEIRRTFESFEESFLNKDSNYSFKSISNSNQKSNTLGETEQSRKLTGIAQEKGTRSEALRQAEILKKVIPLVESVIFDDTLPTIAQVDAGGRTIRLNPTLLTTDAIGHEFGHILIDILGGMSSTLIKVGRQQLVGSDIEQAVFAAYPDLVGRADERIDKEILTTAVGFKVQQLFKEQEMQNKWMRWLIRFFRAIRVKLGIESSAVLELAQKLVSGTAVVTKEDATASELKRGMYKQGRASVYAQYSRNLGNNLSLLDQMVVSSSDFQKDAALIIQKKLDVLGKKGTDSIEYKELSEMLPRMQNANPVKGIIQMIRFAVSSTKDMNDKYLAYEKQLQHPKEGLRAPVYTAKLLSEWRTSVGAWDMLEDLRTMLNGVRNKVELFGDESDAKALNKLLSENKDLLRNIIDPKKFKQHVDNKDNIIDMLLPMLDSAISIKKTIQQLYIDRGHELTVEWIFPYVKHAEIIHRENYEREWLTLDDKAKAEKPRNAYILDKMVTNKATIEKDTRDLIMRELVKADGDISYLTRLVDTILDSQDVMSSSLARAVYTIHEKSRRESLKAYYEFNDHLIALEKQQGRTSITTDEKFWDWILETEKNGQYRQSIISQIPTLLLEDFEAYKDMINSPLYQDNDGNKPSDEGKRKLIRDWIDTHAKVDKVQLRTAQEEFMKDLQKRGLATEKEAKRWLNAEKVTWKAAKTDIREIFANGDALQEVAKWKRIHYWSFRELSPFYKGLNAKWYALEAMRKNGLKNNVQTDQRVIFYDFLSNVIDESSARLPGKYALGTELPSLMKGLGQRYRSSELAGISKMEFLKQEFKSNLQRQKSDTEHGGIHGSEDDLNSVGKETKEINDKEGTTGTEKTALINEAGEPVYFLPIYYTQNLAKDKGKRMPLQDQSFDIASLYFNYYKMSIDYANKAEYLAELEMTNFFINERDVIDRDENGKINIDATAKKMKLIGTNIRDKAIKKSGRNSLIAAQVEDFMKNAIYGISKEEEPDMNIFGFKVDRAKFLDAINSYTSLNLLGMNFVAGIANINLGEVTQVIESMAGQFVTTKNLAEATGYYYKNLGGILGDIGARRPTNIVSLLNDRFSTLNEEVGGKINLNSKFANMFKTNTIFFTSHCGEHYMQTRFMLAMLKNLRAVDSSGKDIGEMLSKITVDEITQQLKVDSEVVNFGETEQTDFSMKMHRVLSSMHGEYSSIGQSALQRVALGRMAIAFRKFIVPGFKRRWQGRDMTNELSGINNLLGDYQEGYYRTFGRFAKFMLEDLKNFKFEAMVAHGSLKGMTKQERANMIRFFGEMSFFLASIIVSSLLMRMEGDDDDDILLDNFKYQALRLKSELSFFINPLATMQILRSPMASMSALEAMIKLFGDITYPITSGTFELKTYKQGTWKGDTRLYKDFVSLLPTFPKQYYRIIHAGDQLSWFKQ